MSSYNHNSRVRRVLVVDDNPSIHEDIRKILIPMELDADLASTEAALFGEEKTLTPAAFFEIDSAYQGQEGLALVERALAEGRPYELAFVDVRMPPGWDGVETIRRIWDRCRELQIVICTAYSDYSWEEILGELGETDSLVILKKPFDNVEVLQLAHTLTRKWSVTRLANARLDDLDAMVRQRTEDLQNSNAQLQNEVLRRSMIEAELRKSEERFRTAFETTGIALAMLRTADRCFTEVNHSFLVLVGRERDDIVGRTPAQLQLVNNLPGLDKALDCTAGTRNLELIFQPPNGAPRHTLVSIEPMMLGDVDCRLLAIMDVSERREMEMQLRQYQKMEAIGQLAAGVAHDFNNLLTVIHGHTNLQLARKLLDTDLCHSLEQVSEAAVRAAALTRQLLAFSRKQAIQFRRLNLNPTLERLRKMLPRLLGEHVQLEYQLAPELPSIQADESGIEQILINLAVNARDAMPDGGRVVISSRVVEMTPEVASRNPEARPGRFVVLTVVDTGCGMDAPTRARIFEPFFTTKEQGKGTGLGLATVFAVVKQHEGWIEVDTEVGKGTAFRILLPVKPSKTDSGDNLRDTLAADTDRVAGAGRTVLVAEDERAVRRFIVKILTQQGFKVLDADDGVEALQLGKAAGGTIQLLVTDMVMPNGVTGSHLARQLAEERPELKVVFISGYSPELHTGDAPLEEGVNFLTKPFDREQLLAIIRRALSSGTRLLPPKPTGDTPRGSTPE
ncbi:MAG: response regulator [Limisphaerales bacterium]